jgi:hypothetical protein
MKQTIAYNIARLFLSMWGLNAPAYFKIKKELKYEIKNLGSGIQDR